MLLTEFLAGFLCHFLHVDHGLGAVEAHVAQPLQREGGPTGWAGRRGRWATEDGQTGGQTDGR